MTPRKMDETNDTLQSSIPTNNNKSKAAPTSLKLPRYAWFLIIGGALIVVVLAIVLPLILIKPASPPTVSTVTPTAPSPSTNYPVMNPAAIRFQTLVPPLEGITKNAATLMHMTDKTVAFLLSGSLSQSATFVANYQSGTIAPPEVFGITHWSSTYAPSLNISVAYTNAWQTCIVDAGCNPFSWKDETLLDTFYFVSPQWTLLGVPLIVSLHNSNNSMNLVLESETTVYSNLFVVIPSATSPLITSVIRMMSSTNQVYLCVGIVESDANQIVYVTYIDTATAPTVNTLAITGTLVYADMSTDGLWMLVLTSLELQLYSRTNSQAVFTLSDTLAFNPQISPQVCSLDRGVLTATDQTMWGVLGTTLKYSLVFSIHLPTGKFNLNSVRQLPSKYLQSTDSLAAAIGILPNNDSVMVILSDNLGNSEMTIFQSTLI